MIQINTCDITDMAMAVDGTEDSAVLGLTKAHDNAESAGEISYKLTASLAGSDLLVSGKAYVDLKAECASCLDEFPYRLEAKEVCHLYPSALGKIIDVTNDIREDLLLGLPLVFRCMPKCKGLCPQCGGNLNRKECTCKTVSKAGKEKASPDKESPWSALDGLKF